MDQESHDPSVSIFQHAALSSYLEQLNNAGKCCKAILERKGVRGRSKARDIGNVIHCPTTYRPYVPDHYDHSLTILLWYKSCHPAMGSRYKYFGMLTDARPNSIGTAYEPR